MAEPGQDPVLEEPELKTASEVVLDLSKAPCLLREAVVSADANFFKGVMFSPDGTCILSASEDASLHVYEVPAEATPPLETSGDEQASVWQPCLKYSGGETVYDMAWYPGMTSLEPATCCFTTTSRDHPIHLWCAYTGVLRATYRAYDHLDELTPATAVAFNCDGTALWGGFCGALRRWDVSRPGRECDTYSTATSKRKRGGGRKASSGTGGQKGLISCIAFRPDASGLFAAGAYCKTVGLYDERSFGLMDVLPIDAAGGGGVTCLGWHQDSWRLFSGGRQDDAILCWDMRKFDIPFLRYPRPAFTNQRFSFDLDSSGRYLATGSSGCEALIYDLSSTAHLENGQAVPAAILGGQPDAVGGVSFSRVSSNLALCTGQRHLDPVDEDEEGREQGAECRNTIRLYEYSNAVATQIDGTVEVG